MTKSDNAVFAAIALALHDFRGNNAQDEEPGIITIKRNSSETLWNAHILQMTQHP